MKIFLHIGAPKCASSSIQQHFSYNHTQGRFAYALLTREGTISTGEQITLKAMKTPFNYASSPGLSIFDNSSQSVVDTFSEYLKQCSQTFDTLFLSNEAWCGNYKKLESFYSVLALYDVEVIFIVRPVVQWTNSCWWEFLNWNPNIKSVDTYVENAQEAKGWLDAYSMFKKAPFAKKTHLLTLQTNIIQQIYEIMGLPYTSIEDKKTNVSSSAELLHFFSLNKELYCADRSLERSLNSHLKRRSPTPWVLSRKNVEDILNNSKESCLELAKYISNENILENPLWWDVAAYEGKIASYNRDINLPYDTVLDMLSEAYVTIGDLNKKLRLRDVEKLAFLNNNLLNDSRKYALPLLRLSYLRYRIISQITFGKRRRYYKDQKTRLADMIDQLK